MSKNPWAEAPASPSLDNGHFHDGMKGRDVPTAEVMERLAEADVVFLGEIHDRKAHRGLQLAVLEALVERTPDVALGLEFFTRQDQALLDDLAAGRLSEVAFRSRVRVADGYPYRELIHLARQRGIRLLGLNLPRWVVSQVARKGWESLPARERNRWPKPSRTSDDYRRLVRKAYVDFEGHHRADFRRFLEAQTLWDATMAESIHHHLEHRGFRPLVVVVGMIHVAYGLGIPSRLDPQKAPSSVIVLHHDALEERLEDFNGPVADYIWFPNVATAEASTPTRLSSLEPRGPSQ